MTTKMNQFKKSILIFGFLAGGMLVSFADRGIRKKSKARVMLNIPTNPFKSNLLFNAENGLKYKGSLLLGERKDNQSLVASSLVTYQKGNTIYILPYKQKMLVPEVKQGYTGMKLIIKPH